MAKGHGMIDIRSDVIVCLIHAIDDNNISFSIFICILQNRAHGIRTANAIHWIMTEHLTTLDYEQAKSGSDPNFGLRIACVASFDRLY